MHTEMCRVFLMPERECNVISCIKATDILLQVLDGVSPSEGLTLQRYYPNLFRFSAW